MPKLEVAIVCVGEILQDSFGFAARPGGAPANVAHHAAALDEIAAVISRVGNDSAGRELIAWLHANRIDLRLLQLDETQSTGKVTVLSGPRYEIATPAAWDFIDLTDDASAAASQAGAVVFGTLAQRQPVSRRTIRALVESARESDVPVFCDLNLRAPFFDEETILWSLRHCDVLKLNREELVMVSRFLGAAGEREDLFAGLLREFGIARAVLTEGAEGALVCEDGQIRRFAAEAVTDVVDTVGAGDAFAAVLAVAMSRGIALFKAAPAAAVLAAHVVLQQGATPVIPRPLAARINAMLGV